MIDEDFGGRPPPGFIPPEFANLFTGATPQRSRNDLLMQLSGIVGGRTTRVDPSTVGDIDGFENFARVATEAGFDPMELVQARNQNIGDFEGGGFARRSGDFFERTGIDDLIVKGTLLAAGAGAATAFGAAPAVAGGGSAPATTGGVGGALGTGGGAGLATPLGTNAGIGLNANLGLVGSTLAPTPTLGAIPGLVGGAGASVLPTVAGGGGGVGALTGGAPGLNANLPEVVSGLTGPTGGGGVPNFIDSLFPGENPMQRFLGAIGGGAGGDNAGAAMNLLGLLGGAGAASGGNFLSDLLGFTNRDQDNLLRSAEFNPPNIALPGGAGGSFDPATDTFSSTLGDLNPLRELILGAGATSGQDPAVANALRQFGLGGLGQSQQDIQAEQLGRMRELALPQEQQQANRLASVLQSKGRFGAEDSLSDQALSQLARTQGEADTRRQLASADFAERAVQGRQGRALDALGLGDAFRGSALQRLLGASGGAQDINRASILPLEVMLGLGTARSNAQLGVGTNVVRAGQDQSNVGDLLGRFLLSGGQG
jgi:hypothetical protein